MIRLDDMQDLVLITDGKFKKRSNFFDISKTLNKIEQTMQFKGSLKNVELKFEAFTQDDAIAFDQRLKFMQVWLAENFLFLDLDKH